jgi:hypothetical protein
MLRGRFHRIRFRLAAFLVAFILVTLEPVPLRSAIPAKTRTPIATPAKSEIPIATQAALPNLPISFEPIKDADRFLARNGSQSLLVAPTETSMACGNQSVRIRLAGANSRAKAVALNQLSGKRNYFVGNDPAKWRTDVPIYSEVRYDEIYPGVNVKYYGRGQQLEYDFEVAPGADPSQIKLQFDRGVRIKVSTTGELIVKTKRGEVREQEPTAYQDIAGDRRPVEVNFVSSGARQVDFRIGSYDRTKPLVIDPVVMYSTYLGGGGDDLASSVAVDFANNVYLAGTTSSTNFPTHSPAYPANAGLSDIFVTKLDSTGHNIVYSTYIGGSGFDRGDGIAIDGSGNAYVVGRVDSSSMNFPTTPGSFASTYRGGDFDGVLFKLNAQGNALVYSAFVGGEENDSTEGVAVDGSGQAYITGGSRSTAFPTTVSAYQSTRSGDTDAYLLKVNASGSALLYGTMLGGGGTDRGSGVVVDGAGNAYIAGYTASADFPTSSAFQNSFGGSFDAFIARIDTNASGLASLVFCSYLGGSGDDKAYGIAIDSSAANVFLVGQSLSTNFPVLNPVQATSGGSVDAFIAKISTAGAKVFATYLGGSGDDRGTGIAVNSSGEAYVAGFTFSTNFPTVNPLQSSNGGGADAFVAKLNSSNSAFSYVTYFGGSANESFSSTVTSTNPIALDAASTAYVVGYTASSNFLTVSPLQMANGGGQDGFIARIADSANNPIDVPDFFVRQHYVDFLNRQPDAPGLAFWVNNITSCGSDQSCTDVKRIDTSAAFFLSIEFQDTGYLVYRIYKASYGNISGAPVPIRLAEFLPDTQEIGSGVIVGQGNWQAQLEANKQAFTLEFVQRVRFTSAYATSLSPTQFVNQMFNNAGMPHSGSDYTKAINEFGSATDTANVTARSKALRDVAESALLNQQEFNRAFVLMQYFGYLRRNPYDPPESTLDYSGYNFWLNKLNTFGNYVNAEMVKSFIVSGEYRSRFGP